jgi:hypothetical protein
MGFSCSLKDSEKGWIAQRHGSIGRRALAGGEMRLEIVGKKFERAFDGWTGHSDEIAEAFTFIESQDFPELFEDRLAALALLNFF